MTSKWIEIESQRYMSVAKRTPVVLVRGQGCRVWDVEDVEYLDFSGGIAVHGSNHIPDYPASHGCVRVSVPAMDWIWEQNLMPLDTPVWVHGAIPGR